MGNDRGVVSGQSAAVGGFEPFIRIEEAARWLSVPVSWLYDAASKGKVPSRKHGKYRVFRVSELEAWSKGE